MDVTPRVWLVVLNWNNGPHTVECLDSILAVADPAVAGVIICDNASHDGCVAQLRAWGNARAPCWLEVGTPERGVGGDHAAVARLRAMAGPAGKVTPFVLAHTGANLGYAGGNNVGLRLVMECGSAVDATLVLNNDTLLTPGCVSAMATRLSADAGLGMCGATVVYARDGRSIQARAGASYQPWLGRASRLGTFEDVAVPFDAARVEAGLDYILGAALMVSRRCLEAIGSMYEGYFLYFEEIDWCLRARRAGFRLGYAPEALVLHKEGGTIGSSHAVERRSLLADHYLTRSRIRFTKRFYPWFLPSVVLYSAAQSARHLMKGDTARAWVQAKALLGMRWQR
jgi:GT2 family glycosyltransferase